MSFPVGTTIGFEIYTFRSGEFTLQGDGGFMNVSSFTSPFLSSAHDDLYSGHTADSSRKTQRTNIIYFSRAALSRKGQLIKLKLVSRARSQMQRKTLLRLEDVRRRQDTEEGSSLIDIFTGRLLGCLLFMGP
jgi:hypothetical protein